jgi:hypothetical protein
LTEDAIDARHNTISRIDHARIQQASIEVATPDVYHIATFLIDSCLPGALDSIAKVQVAHVVVKGNLHYGARSAGMAACEIHTGEVGHGQIPVELENRALLRTKIGFDAAFNHGRRVAYKIYPDVPAACEELAATRMATAAAAAHDCSILRAGEDGTTIEEGPTADERGMKNGDGEQRCSDEDGAAVAVGDEHRIEESVLNLQAGRWGVVAQSDVVGGDCSACRAAKSKEQEPIHS